MTQGFESIVFNDWESLLEFVERPLTDDEAKRAISQFRRLARKDFGDRAHWTQVDNFGEALSLARNGYDEYLERAQTQSERVASRVVSHVERLEPYYDVEGSGIDVARFLQGEPECWQAWKPEAAEIRGSRIIRIMYDYFVSAGVSTDVIVRVGIRIASLINSFELCGYRVEFVACLRTAKDFSADDKAYEISRVTVKRPQEALDLSRLLFVVAHPAMFRQIGFDIMDKASPSVQEICNSYRCTSTKSKPDDCDLFVECKSLYDDLDEAKADAWILKQLKAQGIEIAD